MKIFCYLIRFFKFEQILGRNFVVNGNLCHFFFSSLSEKLEANADAEKQRWTRLLCTRRGSGRVRACHCQTRTRTRSFSPRPRVIVLFFHLNFSSINLICILQSAHKNHPLAKNFAPFLQRKDEFRSCAAKGRELRARLDNRCLLEGWPGWPGG